MALTYKTRRRLSLLILLVGMPAYIALAWWVMSLFERPGIWLEFAIYIVLGILWVLPFKAVFKGVGQADPDAPRDE
jgi:predicted membrane channel-forming protein YqfA (hemolysin III family)